MSFHLLYHFCVLLHFFLYILCALLTLKEGYVAFYFKNSYSNVLGILLFWSPLFSNFIAVLLGFNLFFEQLPLLSVLHYFKILCSFIAFCAKLLFYGTILPSYWFLLFSAIIFLTDLLSYQNCPSFISLILLPQMPLHVLDTPFLI